MTRRRDDDCASPGIEVRLPGVRRTNRKTGEKRFISSPWCVDTRAKGGLAKRIAPCVIHTLDAFFNGLVVEGLHAAGIEQLVAIHDSWFRPDYVETELYDDNGDRLPGASILAYAIEDAGQEWLRASVPSTTGSSQR